MSHWLANDMQEINVQNMNVELVAQMFKNYQSNVLFHLEGIVSLVEEVKNGNTNILSNGQSEGTIMSF